jgi:uncharacterized protein (DUF2147 family)
MPAHALIGILALSALAHDPSSIDGLWRSPGGNSIMKIAACGKSPCGTVAWATDKARNDSKKTTPHLVGTHLLTHLERRKGGGWQGKLFIPDMNMHVTAKLHRAAHHELKVSGCAIICKSAVWTAFTRPLPTDTASPAPR